MLSPWQSESNWGCELVAGYIYAFLRHRIWILSQIHWSRTGSVGIFPPLSKSLQVITFPQIQFCSSESGTESRSCAWEKYKYILPPAHILSCSLTVMVITSHMNGKQRGESQVPGNRVIKQLISSAPMSTHLKGGGDLEPLSCSVAVKRAISHLSQFRSFWL